MDPRTYSRRETSKDGNAVTVRSIRPADSNSLREAFKGLDQESVYRRFFSPKKELSPAELEQLTDVDFGTVVALVVTRQSPNGELLIGGGRYCGGGARSNRSRDRVHDQRRVSRPGDSIAHSQAPTAHRS
jgi:hypothetical protein